MNRNDKIETARSVAGQDGHATVDLAVIVAPLLSQTNQLLEIDPFQSHFTANRRRVLRTIGLVSSLAVLSPATAPGAFRRGFGEPSANSRLSFDPAA